MGGEYRILPLDCIVDVCVVLTTLLKTSELLNCGEANASVSACSVSKNIFFINIT